MAPVLEMMLRGIKVDFHARDALIQDLESEQSRLDNLLQRYGTAILDEPIKASSTKQIPHLFYEVLGFKPLKKYDKSKKEERISTDREALEKLAKDIRANALCLAILARRDSSKKISVLKAGVDADGRMRFSINIGGTETGRLSSSKNAFGGGMNGQNINQKLRKIFVPSDGYKFIEIDLKQADSVGVAYLSGNKAYRVAIDSGDLHTYVARLVWPELPWNGDIKKDKKIAERPYYRDVTYRQMAKHNGHGANYLETPRTLSQQLKIPIKAANDFTDKYFGNFPEIREWQKSTIAEVQTKGYLITPFGRKRRFLGRTWDNSTLREAVAFVPQSLTADYINLGLLRIWKAYPEIRPLMQVHDSLLSEVPIELTEQLTPRMQELIEVPLGDFRCATDAACGWNWSKYADDNKWGLASLPDMRQKSGPQVEELDRRIS